jgi:hypothetical protein
VSAPRGNTFAVGHGRPPEPAVVLDRLEQDLDKLVRAHERYKRQVLAAVLMGADVPPPRPADAPAWDVGELATGLRHLARVVAQLRAGFEALPARSPAVRPRLRRDDRRDRREALDELAAYILARWEPEPSEAAH